MVLPLLRWWQWPRSGGESGGQLPSLRAATCVFIAYKAADLELLLRIPPPGIDYATLQLSAEDREKLAAARPASLQEWQWQAQRWAGLEGHCHRRWRGRV